MQMLSMPSTEDPMETDADRRAELGEDIEIDLDLGDDVLLDEEDASMSEGELQLNEQILATTPQDDQMDAMVDEGHHDDVLYDSTSLQDEDLQDVEDLIAAQPDRQDQTTDIRRDEPSTAAVNTDAAQHEWLATNEDPNSQAPQQQNPQIESNPQYHLSEPNFDLYAQDQRPDGLQPVIPNGTSEGFPQDPYDRPDINKGNEFPEERGNAVLEAIHGSIDQQELPATSLDQDGANRQGSLEQNGKITLQKAQNREVYVTYEGAELSLFPQRDQEYLLEDEKLIDVSILKLLTACKPVLGEDVQDLELVIGVDDLDLEISEFAAEAGVTSLSHLNDLYSHLQLNDGIKSPKSLHLNLYCRPSISDRLSYLRNAVENGVGLSVVSRLPDTPTDELSQENDGGNDEGNDEGIEKEGTELLLTHDANEQNLEESSDTLEQEDNLSVKSDSALLNTSTLQKPRSIPNAKEAKGPTTDDPQADRSADKVTNPETDHQNGVHGDSASLKQPSSKTSSNGKLQQEKTQKLTSGDDEDDVIKYDDHEPIGSKPSSGTSALRSDNASTTNQPTSSRAQPASSTKDAHPETETSSHALEESFTNELSKPLHVNEQEHRPDGREEVDNRKQGVPEHSKPANDGFETVDQQHGFQATDEYNLPTGVEGEIGGNENVYYQDGGENEYGTSFEGHGQDQTSQLHNQYYEPTGVQPQSIVNVNPGEANNATEQDFQAAENFGGIIEDSTFLEDQDHIDDFEQPLDIENQATIQSKAFLDDRDEITFDEDDDAGQIGSSNIGQDQLLNPQDLKKRSRSGTDADDDTAHDPQDAKRIRSN